jgi:hypothetical protein
MALRKPPDSFHVDSRPLEALAWHMKVETTVRLSEELLAALFGRAPDATLRSDLVEAAVRTYFVRLR